MTWTQDGVDYVCQKYGDINECVVSGGLIFDFIDDLGNPFTGMTGSTADIVSLVAFGLASSITMTTPSRSTILNPETELDNANRGTVTQPDAMELIDHDERSADQWCYIAPVPCSSYTNQVECEANNCYWWNDACHDLAPTSCDQLNNQTDCEWYGCYWYDDACHSTPQEKEEIPWLLYVGIATVVVGGIAVIIKRWR